MADNTVKVTKEIETTKSSHYALNDQPPMGRRFLLGLQHMLAMFVGVITPPILIANAAGLGAAETSFMVSMTLIMSGIVTFVQCKRFGPIGAGLLGGNRYQFYLCSDGNGCSQCRWNSTGFRYGNGYSTC